MGLTPEQLYRVHVENLSAVKVGVERIERELKAAISRGDEASSDALLKILLLLLGSWTECRLKKLLFEPNGFGSTDRVKITSLKQQLQWWTKAVELGFRKSYNLPRATLPAALPPMARLLYNELIATIESDLRPIIEMRNTLAHGQWAKPLNSSNTDISPPMIVLLRNENALSAHFKMLILERLVAILHDLVSGNVAFERDFNTHFTRLEAARRNLRVRSYADWKTSMEQKFVRGRVKRDAAIKARGISALAS